MARNKNFTPEELNRSTKIILYFTDKSDYVFEEQKAYFTKFKNRRIIEINDDSITLPIKHYSVQALARNSMRSVKFDNTMTEDEVKKGIILCRNFFKVGLISISDNYVSKLDNETLREFFKEKNGVDFLINFYKKESQPTNLFSLLHFAKQTGRELVVTVNYDKMPNNFIVHKKAIELSIEHQKAISYNPFLDENK